MIAVFLFAAMQHFLIDLRIIGTAKPYYTFFYTC
nr:MAG TPA: hypothetical protein [Caudoviricetes sp.]